LAWCLNILTNSNFILRLIEWQSETNLFTIRIRARQWYWVYKIDLKNFFSVLNINKNIGRNKWFQPNQVNNAYSMKSISLFNNKILNKSLLNHWNEFNLKFNNINKSNYLINIESTIIKKSLFNNMNKVNNFNLSSKYFFRLKSNFGNTLLNFDDNFNLKINDYFLKLKKKNKKQNQQYFCKSK